MNKLLLTIVLALLWFVPANADNHCPDKNPEIILDLGGTSKDDWFIRPVNIVGQKPTYELVMPLSNGKFRIVKVIDDKLTEIESDK